MHTLRVLLTGILDYAGLFPPAKLDMAETVGSFARSRSCSESWMLGRLIVPVARLEEFERAAAELLPPNEEEDMWLVSALTAPAGDEALAKDIETILAFNERHLAADQGAAYIDVVEIKAGSAKAIDQAIACIPDDLYPYFEIPLDGDARGLLAALAGHEAGAKIRTGGVTPDAVPSVEEVAGFIAACAAAEVPMKATAGLHHPLRHRSESLGGPMHGFLNVFGAACVAWCERADVKAIEAILNEQHPDRFRFEDETMTIGEHTLSAEGVEEARERFAHSFGSCSFDEPREDLQSLHLLEKVRPA
jgi:hypothetical protein